MTKSAKEQLLELGFVVVFVGFTYSDNYLLIVVWLLFLTALVCKIISMLDKKI